ncbi:hypothetical protein WME73_05795 [Sorangium sp. So ce302]|uniref:hypothetical protein n=1 Tax=Sorangium sp. So ce302 TaxID=3133297 RepID=UPI003F6452F8
MQANEVAHHGGCSPRAHSVAVSVDNIVPVDGVVWQLDQGYLAGQVVCVARCFVAAYE